MGHEGLTDLGRGLVTNMMRPHAAPSVLATFKVQSGTPELHQVCAVG